MKLIKHPALHMLLIGGLLFAGAAFHGGRALLKPRPQITVAQHRVDLMVKAFVSENYRFPTKQEYNNILDTLIDEEVLYNYALTLKMDKHPAVERRLAQIAEFVEANPHEAESSVEVAKNMGLHHGDLLIRRILIDSARRLIRAVVLLQEPKPQLVEEYYTAHQDEFVRPTRSRISQIMVNGFKWPDSHAQALRLLKKIQAESLDVEAAVALGDKAFVDSHLPMLTEQALASKFSPDFATKIFSLPEKTWIGPISSQYGEHLVYIHERFQAQVPPLEKIRDSVKSHLLHKLADEWLALRVQEIRLEYEIITPQKES